MTKLLKVGKMGSRRRLWSRSVLPFCVFVPPVAVTLAKRLDVPVVMGSIWWRWIRIFRRCSSIERTYKRVIAIIAKTTCRLFMRRLKMERMR